MQERASALAFAGLTGSLANRFGLGEFAEKELLWRWVEKGKRQGLLSLAFVDEMMPCATINRTRASGSAAYFSPLPLRGGCMEPWASSCQVPFMTDPFISTHIW